MEPIQPYSLSLPTIALIILTLLWFVKLSRSSKNRAHQKLPPGPWKLPIIGNLRGSAGRQAIFHGYEIPIETKVIENAWAIGRDPDCWDDAESFVPERFDGSSVDYKGTNFECIPFGAGRRMCPGIAVGVANLELPLANLFLHFNRETPKRVKTECVGMSEAFGATVGTKNNLYLIANSF